MTPGNKNQGTRRKSSLLSDKVDIKPNIRRAKAHYIWMGGIIQQEVIAAIKVHMQISAHPNA